MKNLKYIVFLILTIVVISSCKESEYMLYDAGHYIQFKDLNDTLKLKTFYYDEDDVVRDTIFFDIDAIGGPKDYDRAINIEQVMIEGVENAVPGLHFVAFDSDDMVKNLVMPKGVVRLSLPIIVLRDKSLKSKTVTLKFRILKNEHFEYGLDMLLDRRLEFTDGLQQPTRWSGTGILYYFGDYSLVKHKWMIEVTGNRWDDEFMDLIWYDTALMNYWLDELDIALLRYNLELKAQGKEPFKDENGKLIVFP